MFKAKQRFTSLIVACVLMFASLFAAIATLVMPQTTAVAETSYVETTFGEGKLLITTTFNGSTYYLPATTTSSGPLATSFSDISEIGEEHLWTVTATGSNYYIQNSEDKYLYTTNTNNGVKVGDTANAWKYDTSANSFQDTVTSRYLGIYNSSNWRCYTTVNQSNYKESSTSFKFYTLDSGTPSLSVSGDTHAQVEDVVTLSAELANITGVVTWASSNTDVASINQNGEVTAIAMGQTTITATINELSKEVLFKVYPVADSSLTIAEALEVCELTGATNAPYTYSVTGDIKSIDTAYDSSYNNITVTITDGTDSITAYRMAGGEELAVDMNITVTGTLVNFGGNTPEFIAGCTYELHLDDTAQDIVNSLDAIESFMNLSYKYTVGTEKKNTVEVTESLGIAATTGTLAADSKSISWASDNFTVVTEKASSTTAIRTSDSDHFRAYKGSITTISSKTVLMTKIVITCPSGYAIQEDWSEGWSVSAVGNTITLTCAAGAASCSTANAGAQWRFSSVEITYLVEGGEGGEEVEVYKNSKFVIRCGIDAAIADIAGVESYGIRVSAGGKTVDYNSTSATSWKLDEEKNVYYVVINLGDIINDTAKLGTEFTVQAYVVYDGITYASTSTKTYSVASMIKAYKEAGESVDHLYNYLVSKGLIEEEVA